MEKTSSLAEVHPIRWPPVRRRGRQTSSSLVCVSGDAQEKSEGGFREKPEQDFPGCGLGSGRVLQRYRQGLRFPPVVSGPAPGWAAGWRIWYWYIGWNPG